MVTCQQLTICNRHGENLQFKWLNLSQRQPEPSNISLQVCSFVLISPDMWQICVNGNMKLESSIKVFYRVHTVYEWTIYGTNILFTVSPAYPSSAMTSHCVISTHERYLFTGSPRTSVTRGLSSVNMKCGRAFVRLNHHESLNTPRQHLWSTPWN